MYTGDEPHYLLGAVSLLKDGDFNVHNNYKQRDFEEFIPGFELRPQLPESRPGLIPTEHGTIFPAIIAPAYKVNQLRGVRTFLILVALATCFLTAYIAQTLSGSQLIGTAAGLLLILAPSWQMHANRVYPEVVAGFLFTGAIAIVLRERDAPTLSIPATAIYGFAGAFMPVLYLKYAALAAPLGLMALFDRRLLRSWGLYAGAAVAIAIGVGNIVFFGDQGALGGAYTGSRFFQLSGTMERYWTHFFDRHHGLAPYQPFALLLPWTLVYVLNPVRKLARSFSGAIAFAALAYTLLHGIWSWGPGYSISGRYLTAALPLMAILTGLWLAQTDRFSKVRAAVCACAGLVGFAFLMTSAVYELPPYEVLTPWRQLFRHYWHIWGDPPISQLGPLGNIVLLLMLATKALARLRAPAASA